MRRNNLKVKVKILASMREVFKRKEIYAELNSESTIQDLLNFLCGTYEQRQRMFDQSGQIRQDVTILKNGRHIHFLDGIETQLKEGDEIAIFPLIYGG